MTTIISNKTENKMLNLTSNKHRCPKYSPGSKYCYRRSTLRTTLRLAKPRRSRFTPCDGETVEFQSAGNLGWNKPILQASDKEKGKKHKSNADWMLCTDKVKYMSTCLKGQLLCRHDWMFLWHHHNLHAENTALLPFCISATYFKARTRAEAAGLILRTLTSTALKNL